MIFYELIWNFNFKKLKLYLNKNERKPSLKSKDLNTKILAKWFYRQIQNYKNNKFIMKNNNIKIKWEQFIFEYKKYFASNYEIWINTLEKVKNYIHQNKCKPSIKNNKKLYEWIYTQQKSYRNNTCDNFLSINLDKKNNIMKYSDIKIKWEQFTFEYKEYLLNNEEKWNNNLEQIISYINQYNSKPTKYSKDNNIKKLGLWIDRQLTIYKNKHGIMKNNDIRIKWENFINKNNHYFLNNEDTWYYYLQKVKLYINKNKCKPSRRNKDNNIKHLCFWINAQQYNYKYNKQIMKNDNIRIKWEDFITDYKLYFK